MMSERVKPNDIDEVTEAILSEVMAQGVTPNRETWERYARAAVGVFLRVIDEEIEGWRNEVGPHDGRDMIDALAILRARFKEAFHV